MKLSAGCSTTERSAPVNSEPIPKKQRLSFTNSPSASVADDAQRRPLAHPSQICTSPDSSVRFRVPCCNARSFSMVRSLSFHHRFQAMDCLCPRWREHYREAGSPGNRWRCDRTWRSGGRRGLIGERPPAWRGEALRRGRRRPAALHQAGPNDGFSARRDFKICWNSFSRRSRRHVELPFTIAATCTLRKAIEKARRRQC